MTSPADPAPIPHCPACGTLLSADASEGLCRACLLKRGLEPNTLPATEAPASRWTPPTPEELAPFFPDLEILRLLGRGGMGAVYKARQKSLDRLVALKILPPQLAADPSFTQRFTHEAQSLAKLHHPHIVTIYDFGRRMGQLAAPSAPPESAPPTTLHFFLMEYVDGLSLRQLLNTSKLEPTTALAIVPQICDALQFAHDRGIIHRDIKPENLLLTQSGQIKIADFGLAKITQESRISAPDGLVAGTPQYMSPEQSSAPATVDARSDIYALGVVLYQMLTGELPQEKFEPPSRKLHIDIRLDQIVLRALEKNPELRYQNATEFKTEIETVLAPPPLSRTASTPPGGETTPSLTPQSSGSPPASLRVPAIALRVVAALNILLCCVPLTGFFATLIEGGLRPSRVNIAGADLLILTVVVLILFANAFAFRAGQNIARRRNYSQALAGSIVIMLFVPLGLAVGLWVLLLLLPPETRGTFSKKATSPPSSPLPPRVGENAASSPPPPPTPPRLSRAALIGAVWAPFTLIAFLGLFTATRPAVQDYHGPSWAQLLCGFIAIPLGLSAPVATTLCGIFSLSRIRRFNGKIYGLPLALFDATLFPLLALDAIISFFLFNMAIAFLGWTHDYSDTHNSQLIVATLVVSILVDYFLVRIAWRTVKPPGPRNAATTPPAHKACPAPGASSDAFRPRRVIITILAALAAAIVGFLLLHPRFPVPAVARIHYRVFEMPAADLDASIPPESRSAAELPDPEATPKSDYRGFPFTASAQTVQIPVTLLATLLQEANNPPALLVDRTRSISNWPRTADSWSYSFGRSDFLGGGGGTLFLGVRSVDGKLQLRVEGVVTHDLNAAGIQALIVWHGEAPSPALTRLFLVPFSRNNGAREFLVIAYSANELPSTTALLDRISHAVPAFATTSHPAPSFTNTLPSGITVQLMGISQNPSDAASWWKPDGSPLSTRPYPHLGARVSPQNDELPREFLIHLSHLPATRIDTEWEFSPNCSSAGGGPLVIDQQSHNDLTAIAASVPRDQPLTIRFGVAAGPWQTVAESSGRGSESMIRQESNIAFSRAHESHGQTTITVSHNIARADVRLIAVDIAGHEQTSASQSADAGSIHSLTGTFDLPLSQIRSFQLQSRPYEWTEFHDFALAPQSSHPALRIKYTYAQKAFEQAEAMQKAGRISQLDLLRARSARDIAAAELAGDSSHVVQLKYQLAEEELHQTEALFQAGRATSLEVAHARLMRDLAAAATQPAATSPSLR